ncbi:SAP domain-containing protein [Fusobacterium sp.]|uniref:SAP domain-containing protein n=1 Tax=Fusobacterium sp. TaxID=68766 RepID=UPI0028FEA31B|nr:SAP domain-containing protein [Fusobacterium sp.]MDU1910386.1 SAP domain-containing protein [Fusobacterium sp.]
MENFNMVLLLKLINEMEYDTEASKLLLSKYEIDEKKYLKIGLKEDYIKIYDIQQGTVKQLKEILKSAGLVQTGNKEALIQRVIDNISEKELKKYFGNDKYKLTPLGRKFLKDNIEELEEILSENGEKKKEESKEEIIKDTRIEENINRNIEKEKIMEKDKVKVLEHKDKFAKNYLVTGIIIILVVVCINIFL